MAQRSAVDPAKAGLEPGTLVDHFKVGRLIGRGGMGEVYLARDTRLGRRVALKVIHPEILGDEEVRERFLNEARLTARFSHPHIVTVYHVGEIVGDGQRTGNPYVALEYLEGQSLRDRLTEQRPALKEALRMGQAIAEALAEAHHHGVLHRDLKPANVLIPTDGRLRVLDFGLAKRLVDETAATVATTAAGADPGPGAGAPHRTGPAITNTAIPDSFETRGGGLRGSPAYMAPEQWEEKSGTTATDIWALGLVLYELVSGRHPFAGAGFHQLCLLTCGPDPVPSLGRFEVGSPGSPGPPVDLPGELVDLVDACLAKDPAKRPAALEVVGSLEQLIAGERPRAQSEENPFRGLMAFGERHADRFYGRSAEIDALMERLRHEPVLPVVGSSGAGKSSFVQAGVIPRLREQSTWEVIRLRPGSRPFLSLAMRLSGEESSSFRLGSGLGSDSSPIVGLDGGSGVSDDGQRRETGEIEPARPAGAQRGAEDRRDRRKAAEQLAAELQAEPGRLTLALLERAERTGSAVLLFVDQLEELYTLAPEGEADSRPSFMEALARAADDPEGPVRVIFTLRDDCLGRVAEAPAAREALGRVTVLRTPDIEALEEILVRPVEAAGYRYEDPQLVGEMIAEVHREQSALPLLQFAGRALWSRRDKRKRLITREAYRAIGGVAGALARHADGILDGLSPEQERAARALFLRLVTADLTRAVVPRRRLLDGLGPQAVEVLDIMVRQRAIVARKGLEGPELELVHESLITQWGKLSRWLEESREERQFLAEVGQAAALWQSRGRIADEAWRGPALAEAQLRAARVDHLPAPVREFLEAGGARERRARRRRHALLGTSGVLLALVALGAVVISVAMGRKEHEAQSQRRRAEAREREARLRRAEALEAGARSALDQGNPLEASARLRGALEIRDSLSARSLWWRLSGTPLRWRREMSAKVYSVAFSPDGRSLAAACADHAIYLFNPQTAGMRVLRGHKDQVFSVAFSPDGQHLASSDRSGRILIWNLATYHPRLLGRHLSGVWGIAFSPDGTLLASGCFGGEVRIWDVRQGRLRSVLRGGQASVYGIAFSPDGALLASASDDHTVRLWDVKTGRQRATLRGHQSGVYDVAFSPDGALLASAGIGRTIRLWDVKTGRQRAALHGHLARIYGVEFSPDGALLASASADGTIRLWDVKTRRRWGVLRGHQASVHGIAFSPDGALIASGGYDRSVRLWDVRAARQQAVRHSQQSGVADVEFSPDGALLASANADGTIRLWDVKTGQQRAALHGHLARVLSVSISPDGALLASASTDRTVRLWDVRTGQQRAVLRGHLARVNDVAFGPRGSILASGSLDQTVRLWDVKTGRQRAVLRGHKARVYSVGFSPDGALLASASADRTVRLWDVKTGRQRAVLRGHRTAVAGVAFSPDGALLASGGHDHTIRIWDVRMGRERTVLRVPCGRVYRLAFHPDGRHIGAPCSDGTAMIRDLRTGSVIVLRGHRSEVNTFRFSPKGDLAATASDDGTVRLWNVRTGFPMWRAPLLRPGTTELFTHSGWTRLDGRASPGTSATGARWRRAVETGASLAAESVDGRLLCLGTYDGSLEMWDPTRDRRLSRQPIGDLAQVLALPGSCVTLADGVVRRHDRSGGVARVLSRGKPAASAMAWAAGDLLVSAGRRVYVLGLHGEEKASFRADANATAVGRVGRGAGAWIVVGYGDGNLELVPTRAGAKRPRISFEGVVSSPVVRILPGPDGTVIAGFGSGLLGMWNLKNGTLLHRALLHGPVIHLLRKGTRLYAASELGGHLVWDLGIFNQGYCDLLRELWARVPILWAGGLPYLSPIPAGHRCAR